MKQNLSKLTKVDLRNVWKDEAQDFTPWLAQAKNLDILSEEIGIDMKPLNTEASVMNQKITMHGFMKKQFYSEKYSENICKSLRTQIIRIEIMRMNKTIYNKSP